MKPLKLKWNYFVLHLILNLYLNKKRDDGLLFPSDGAAARWISVGSQAFEVKARQSQLWTSALSASWFINKKYKNTTNNKMDVIPWCWCWCWWCWGLSIKCDGRCYCSGSKWGDCAPSVRSCEWAGELKCHRICAQNTPEIFDIL